MKKRSNPYVLLAGMVIAALGIILALAFSEASGLLERLPFVFIGIGLTMTGIGALQFVQGDSKIKKQLEIEEKDERNIRLREKAGFATWFITLFMLTALFLVFVVLDIDIAAWLSAGVLLIHIISIAVSAGFYSKKM